MSLKRTGDLAEKLLECFESNTTDQADGLMTVPASIYTDPHQREHEIEVLFKRLPLMLALTCEIPKLGDYKALDVVGQPVLITRDKSGTVRAFLNVCSHRWSPVAAEGVGNCSRLRLTCPFHGWTFGMDGKLIAVADRSKFGEFDRSRYGLTALPCEEKYGMIFVRITPGAPFDLDAYYGEILEDYAQFKLETFTFVGRSEMPGPNWKLIFANFFESYHFATQHAKTVIPTFISNLCVYEQAGPHMRIGYALRELTKLREIPRAQWDDQESFSFTFMRYFFPNVIGSLSKMEISLFSQMFPGPTPETSRVVTLHLRQAQPGDDTMPEKLGEELQKSIKAINDIVRDEDFATAYATQKGLCSNAHEGLLYGRNERGPQYFHKWINWYLQGSPNAPRPAL